MVIRLVTYVVVTHPVSAKPPSHAVFMWLEFIVEPTELPPPKTGFACANAGTTGAATTSDAARARADRSAAMRWMNDVKLLMMSVLSARSCCVELVRVLR